jgi:hypothetical protein
LLEATAVNTRLSLNFYQVMHMLKPSMALFTPRVFAAVLFRKKPLQAPQQDVHQARATLINKETLNMNEGRR